MSETFGQLRVHVESQNAPVSEAKVVVFYSGVPGNVLKELETDENGNTEEITLQAPPREYSLKPSVEQPYAEYTIRVEKEGFGVTEIVGVEIFSGEKCTQNIELHPKGKKRFEDYIISAHTLFGNYPSKIPEKEIKPLKDNGEIVLSYVGIPEYVIVHDGAPSDPTAKNYYVRYRDYIKNVACSEIYATWPVETIKANVLAIMSFTLNRVYTEWYRSRGYDFTITSSTAFDHKWICERNIFDKIAEIVDELFENYLSRPNVRQPILTQYCDGRTVSCPNWLSQWGSKYLGDQGYTAIEILRYYYGDDIYINSAEELEGVLSSWPGYALEIGSRGYKVRHIQEQLNEIGKVYRAIPTIAPDGIYGKKTQHAVEKFQSVFGLKITGIVDYRTWYKIQEIYVGESKIGAGTTRI